MPDDGRAWFGNSYYDKKKHRWINGPYKIHRFRAKGIITTIILFVLLSAAITLALNYFFPGTKLAIFAW